MKLSRHRPSPAMVVAVAALLLAAGGVAFATIPDSSGTIHACFAKANGNLRVVDSAVDCRQSESPLSWTQQGASGGAPVERLPTTSLADGQSKVLFVRGPLTFTARCRLDVLTDLSTGPVDLAEVLVSTTQDHAAFSADDSVLTRGKNADLASNASDRQRRIFNISRLGGAQDKNYGQGSFAASAPDGTSVTGVLLVGLGVLNHNDQCVFGGHVIDS